MHHERPRSCLGHLGVPSPAVLGSDCGAVLYPASGTLLCLMITAAAMPFISLSVFGDALRLRGIRV